MSKQKIIKELTVVEHGPYGWKKKQKMFIVDGNEEKFAKYLGLDAEEYPLGTRFQILMLEPEPPKERVVLPEGMKWDIAELLWTADGTLIASACCGNAWYCVPFMLARFTIENKESLEDTKRYIENILAEHDYFGVKKVVDNE